MSFATPQLPFISRLPRLCLCALFCAVITPPSLCGAEPGGVSISEFMASNDSTIQDEDGDFSDWIEIYNGQSAPVSLSSYSLTDNATAPRKWLFPDVSIAPGTHLLVYASGKNRRDPAGALHTNFKLDADGEYLGLFLPDGLTTASEYAPAFPPQRANVSFGPGLQALGNDLVTSGAEVSIFVPTDGALGTIWNGGSEPFDDSPAADWISGTGGIGYVSRKMPILPLGFWNFDDWETPNEAQDLSGLDHSGQIASQNEISGSGGTGKPIYTEDALGHSGQAGDRALDFGGAGNGAIVLIPAAADGAFDSVVAENSITISLWIYGGSTQPAGDSVFWGATEADGTGTRSLNAHVPWSDSTIYWDTGGQTAGTSRVSKAEADSTKWKGTWNHYVFLKNGNVKEIWQNGTLFHSGENVAPLTLFRYLAIGAGSGFGNISYGGRIDDFALWDRALTPEQIASLALGSSPLALTEESPLKALVNTNIGDAMQGISASAYARYLFTVPFPVDFNSMQLRMKYDDGFVAYLNGIECARSNAPVLLNYQSRALTDRPFSSALFEEIHDITPFIDALRDGPNVLAIHGLNHTPESGEFLLQATLGKSRTSQSLYLTIPTPGEANTDGQSGFVADTKFDHDRGFYDAPILVSVTCKTSSATIRYTLDGSAPTMNNGALYVDPISIDKTTVLRAAAFKVGMRPSDVDTQTYIFLNDVIHQPALPDGFPASWGDGPGVAATLTDESDYEMDQDVADAAPFVDRDGQAFGSTDALKGIPTVSLVMELDDLFGLERGIYANARMSGPEWERPVSIEYIDPEGGPGFQENCGARMHGGWNRFPEMLKKSFRLYFRDVYGAGKLRFPLFPGSPVKNFDKLVLRSGNGQAWPSPWRDEGALSAVTYQRDQFARDSQRDMGRLPVQGRFVHLYLNGLYWGLYNLTERPDSDFLAAHLGGKDEEFDVVNWHRNTGPSPVDGDMTAWDTMMTIANQGLELTENYVAIGEYLDIESFIDYMIMNMYIGTSDWLDNNVYAGRRREPGAGFLFFAWDAEQSIAGISTNRTGVNLNNTVGELYDRLRGNAEFRLLFADHLHRHFFNDGALTPTAADARWMYWGERLDRPIVGESMRWGDRNRDVPFTRDVEWLREQERIRFNYFQTTSGRNRSQIVLDQFRAIGLYPSVEAPEFNQHGGNVPHNFPLTIANPNGAGILYYTTDGSDPRVANPEIGDTLQILPETAAKTVLVPSAQNSGDEPGLSWTGNEDFDDSLWTHGTGGVGYDLNATYTPYFSINLQAAMHGQTSSTFVRTPFLLAPDALVGYNSLALRVRYDDGFVAFLNGQRIAEANAPDPLEWYSAASGSHDDSAAVLFENFDVSQALGAIRSGENILAFQGLNYSTASSDFLLSYELSATQAVQAPVSPGAEVYTGPFALTHNIRVKARIWSNGEWSALSEAVFMVERPPGEGKPSSVWILR